MKTRIALLLLLIIGTVACHRKVCGTVFRPQTCQLNPIPMNHTDSISGLEYTDSMYLSVNFGGEMIESCASHFPSLSFGGEAMALVIMPMKWESPICSFEITSNQAFNGIPAGQPLNDKLWGIAEGNKLPMEEYLRIVIAHQTNPFSSMSGLLFEFKERPQTLVHTFRLVCKLKNRTSFEVTTTNVEWK